MMQINVNGVRRDMTQEEEDEYLAECEEMASREPTPEERIEVLEAIIEAQAVALERLGVIPDA